MTRFFFFALLLLLASMPALAQDMILELNGNELTGQVLEVTPTQVLYRPEGTDPALPPTVLEKRTLFMIKFANGTKETFAQNLAPSGTPTAATVAGDSAASLSEAELYRKGQRDALKLHNYKGAFWGTYAATLTTGYGGIIAGGIIGLSRPKAARNPLVPSQMLQSRSYVMGYEKQAQRRKLGKAAEGFGAAVGTGVAIILAFAVLLVAVQP